LLDLNELTLDVEDYNVLDAIGKAEVGSSLLIVDTFADKEAVQAALDMAVTAASSPFTCGISTITFIYNDNAVNYGTILSSTGKCFLDRNLGATQVATEYNDYHAYGDLFQWGRSADGHQAITWTSSSTGTPVYGSTSTNADVPSNNLFITENDSPYDWRVNQNSTLWESNASINNPCPTGWRIPTNNEWQAEIDTLNEESTTVYSKLKLTVAGYRDFSDASLGYMGSDGYYWSSSVNSTDASNLYVVSNAEMYPNYRANGYSIRCLKDSEIVDPDIALLTADKEALVDTSIKGDNTNLTNITIALANPLPTIGSVNNSTITWTSNTPAIVSNDGQTITRPIFGTENATVIMTATLTKGAQTTTKTFSLTVLAETVDPASGAKIEIEKITAETIGIITIGDNSTILQKTQELISTGYTVSIKATDGIKIDATGIAIEAGTGSISFTVTEDSDSTNTADTTMLSITVNAFVSSCEATVSYSGKTYNTVEIGDQCWFKENLNIGTLTAATGYLTGTPDIQGSSCNNVKKYCWLNDESYCNIRGGLYQWDQAMCGSHTPGAQGICPLGWHVSTDDDWKTMEIFLGMTQAQTDSFHSRGTQGQQLSSHVYEGNNSSGFSALLTGLYEQYDGCSYSSIWLNGSESTWEDTYLWETASAYFWTSTEYTDTWWEDEEGGDDINIPGAWYSSTTPLKRVLNGKDSGNGDYHDTGVTREEEQYTSALPVRCIKD
jgi:uncharacterized protein (TIGR02145 family)